MSLLCIGMGYGFTHVFIDAQSPVPNLVLCLDRDRQLCSQAVWFFIAVYCVVLLMNDALK